MYTQPDLTFRRGDKDRKREAGLPLDGDDLFIRSVSTILRWMQHTADAPSNKPEDRPRRGHFLDRVALTFVSGTRPVDVAAVIYWDRTNSRLLVDANPGEHGFDVVKNSPLLEVPELPPVSDDVEARQLLMNDMYKFLYERGVDAISLEMHASTMQSLLNNVHDNLKNPQEDIKTARRNLRHYIYMYCTCKIWQRFTARAPRFGYQINHFFLGKNGKDLLLQKDSFDVEIGIPTISHLQDQDETWLWEQLREFDRTGTVDYKLESVPVANSQPVSHLVLNKEVLWSLYRFSAACIQRVRQATFGIRTWIRTPQLGRELSNKNRDRMKTFLDDMHSSFYRLHHLLHRCPSFWRLVEVLGVISLQKLEELKKRRESAHEKEVVNHSRPSSSSSSALESHMSSTDSTPPPTYLTSRRHGFKDRSRTYPHLADDILADEVELNMIHSFSEVVRGWLQFITRWYHAVQDLCDREVVRAAVQHGFVISATTATGPELPHRQRSLVTTLWSLHQPKKWTIEQARDAIKARATELVQAMKLQSQDGAVTTDAASGKADPPTIHDRQLKALKILADFSEESIQQWEEAFEGCVHCEADLACKMYLEDRNICEELIGISKRCCFCCDAALRALHPSLGGISTHGKIYHWAPPPETPSLVKDVIINGLKIEFDRFVRHYLNPNEADESRPITSDSSRGSNSGSVSSPTPSSIAGAASLDESVSRVAI